MTTPRSILVVGDLVVDHHIYEGQRRHFGEALNAGVTMVAQAGGAALVHDLLSVLIKPLAPDWSVHLPIELPVTAAECLDIDEAEHAYAFWRPYPHKPSAKERYWRVSEAMGFGRSAVSDCKNWRPATVPGDPAIIVISEGGMGFRGNTDCWKDLPFASATWIVLKTAAPIGEGPLWEHLTSAYRDKLVVVVAARDLRRSSAPIARGSSWESTVHDLAQGLIAGAGLAALRSCRHLLISFDDDGGLWVDAPAAENRGLLLYAADGIEGDHATGIIGEAFGLLSCLAATATWSLVTDSDTPDFAHALERGIAAMHDLREHGHGPVDHRPPTGFPTDRLATLAMRPGHRYTAVAFAMNEALRPDRAWSLLRDSQRGEPTAHNLAKLVVRRGPIALRNVPHLQVGKLLAVDRREIEALRTIIATMRTYKSLDRPQRPLSLAVLGPPGAGKSFAVKQIAQDLLGEEAWLEFNLSQFDTDDLLGAFHQIRDRVLQGILPVAFFDEFDSQKYRWLQYLLAPMQDGKFQEGQLTHTIGKCILVFAGGTSWTFDTFGPPDSSVDPATVTARRDFELAKGPDFASRIDVYLDVVGPNRRQKLLPDGTPPTAVTRTPSGHPFVEDGDDISYPLRRALMIRSELGCSADEKLDVDDALLEGLLTVRRYLHGSRSLSKVVQPLRHARPGKLTPSFLPPLTQLAMHVGDTGALTRGAPATTSAAEHDVQDLAPDAADRIAASIHEDYRLLARQLGELDAELDVPFETLRRDKQDPNRAAAKRMPAILALVGLRLAKGQTREALGREVRQYLAFHLELLADAEHDGWMAHMHENGWRYSATRDNKQKLHPCLLPFGQLREADRLKDRDTIRHYPEYAQRLDMHIDFQPAER